MNKNTMVVLSGIPASGKSTFAKQFVKEHEHDYIRINLDSIREMVYGNTHTFTKEKLIKKIQAQIINSCFKDKLNMIIDNTNLSVRRINHLHKLCLDHDYMFRVIQFDTPLENCLERDSQRRCSVGENVIMEMNKIKIRDDKLIKYSYNPIIIKGD